MTAKGAMDLPCSVRRPVGELRPGDHAWLAFADEDERGHVVGPFVGTGLACGDRIVMVGGPPGAVPGGGDRVTVVPLAESPSGDVDPQGPARALAAEIAEAERWECRGCGSWPT
jgi:hypothetical protein